MFANRPNVFLKPVKQVLCKEPFHVRYRRKYTSDLLRSLKRLNSKTLTLLGFASKAGKLAYGAQKTIEYLNKNKSCLIVTACDLSTKSKKEILFFASDKKVPVVVLKDVTVQKLSTAVGRKCGVISVNDSGFADAINNQEAMLNANDQ